LLARKEPGEARTRERIPIEEKLVELHKRSELAERTLGGAYASARLDADELLAVLRGD